MTAAPVSDAAEGAPDPSRRSRLRLILSIGGPLIVAGLLAYLLASNGHQILKAVRRGSISELVLVTVLALVTLVARTEAVVACLNAMGSRPRRADIHAANALTFLAALINHYVSAIVRGALLRRIDKERSPTIPQMLMVDTSTTLIEGLVVVALIVISSSVLKLQWWIPVLVALTGIAAAATALWLRHRFAHRQLFRGLNVLVHSRQRTIVSALMLIVIGTQVLRTFMVLRAVGLHPSLLQAVATFVAAGVLSSLFAGPGAGTAGGPLIVFGHNSLAASAAAGLELSITMLIAGLLYAFVGAPVFLWRMRQAI